MSGVAGYKAQLKLGGDPTEFSAGSLTRLTLSNYEMFRIEATNRKVLSANHPIVIKDYTSDTVFTPSHINYLEGVFYFEGNDDTSIDLYIDSAHYIPLEYIGGAKEYSLEIGGDVLDDSSFHSDSTLSAGYRTKVCGIHDISVSFSRWNNFNNKLLEAKQLQTPIFVSINPGASRTFIKGWFQIETDSLSGDIGSLEDESLSLVLCGNNSKTYFSYSQDYNLNEAEYMTIEELVANYFPEL